MQQPRLEDLDWNEMYRRARQEKSWKSKGAADWDRKAASFAERTERSIYTEKFLALLQPEEDWSVLDVGCGPGTLALPLARRVKRVTALDFSARMLEILQERVGRAGIDNITACHAGWGDDWQARGIGRHDVAIASRSLAVPDLRAALEQLCRHATHRVAVTDRVRHGPFDPDAFAAVGRPLRPGPDYIYTVNLLYRMGFLPSVAYIVLEEEMVYDSLEDAVESYRWMFRDLDPAEEKRLQKYVRSITTSADNGSLLLRRRHVPTWAFISWRP
ncbi:MAG TPA: class I SAM-dependent methyltransferase [Desulfobulbus sp.]|nr:class I SAM-dependent methyltransferase [Desulfobulbus sp.]